MKTIFTFFICLTLNVIATAKNNKSSGDSTTIRPSINKIILGIAEYNVLDNGGVGESGIRTKQWDRFEKLESKASNNELKILTNYKNAVVRGYAF
jgi:hypothetical protein